MMMHATFISVLSLCTVAFAAPVSWGSGSYVNRDYPVSRGLFSSFTGIEICGLPSRGDVQPGCLANPLRFTLVNNVLTAAASGAQPANTECDHSLELQVLKKALDGNGACTALDKILKAGSIQGSDTKKALLQPLFDAVNGQSNSVFLEKSVNAEKRLVVQHALGDDEKRPASTALTAVKAYLSNSQIVSASKALARNLDSLTATMISNAVTQANKAINGKTASTSRQKSAQTTALNDVKSGEALYKSSSGVATAWQTVLSYASEQA